MNKQEHEALRLCVASLDQLLPYLAKVPADVGLLNGALMAARPLLNEAPVEPAPAQDGPAPSQYSDVVSDGGMDPRNAPAPAQDEQQQPVAHRECRVIGFRPGMGEVTFYVEGGVPQWMNIGETIYVSDAAPIAQTDPWQPSGADYDRAIHDNPDAKAWADLFVDTFPGLKDKHDLMIGWFANAMMAMHDHLARKTAPQQRPTAYPHEAMDKLAADRYRVGAAGAGTLHGFAVRAGDGEQELYRGSKSDCEHVARKLAGAFLDGGFTAFERYAAHITQTAPQSDCEWCAGAGHDPFGDKCQHCKTAPQPEQSGLVLMPKEATPEIVAAMKRELDKAPTWYCRYSAAYRAALSAQGQSNGNLQPTNEGAEQ